MSGPDPRGPTASPSRTRVPGRGPTAISTTAIAAASAALVARAAIARTRRGSRGAEAAGPLFSDGVVSPASGTSRTRHGRSRSTCSSPAGLRRRGPAGEGAIGRRPDAGGTTGAPGVVRSLWAVAYQRLITRHPESEGIGLAMTSAPRVRPSTASARPGAPSSPDAWSPDRPVWGSGVGHGPVLERLQRHAAVEPEGEPCGCAADGRGSARGPGAETARSLVARRGAIAREIVERPAPSALRRRFELPLPEPMKVVHALPHRTIPRSSAFSVDRRRTNSRLSTPYRAAVRPRRASRTTSARAHGSAVTIMWSPNSSGEVTVSPALLVSRS